MKNTEFVALLKELSDLQTAKYKSYAYSAGFMEGMLGRMFSQLKKDDQKFFMETLQDAITSYNLPK